MLCIIFYFYFFCTVHWADLSWPPFHYWLYPVWLCMWQINENLEPIWVWARSLSRSSVLKKKNLSETFFYTWNMKANRHMIMTIYFLYISDNVKSIYEIGLHVWGKMHCWLAHLACRRELAEGEQSFPARCESLVRLRFAFSHCAQCETAFMVMKTWGT